MGGLQEKIEAANKQVCGRMIDAQPVLVDVCKAIDVVPGFAPNLILHSGPPIAWDRMCEPQRNGVVGAILFEGLAGSAKEAEAAVARGDVTLAPCHFYKTVGAMGGITSASMYVYVVRNEVHGNVSFSQIYGQDKGFFRYGVYNDRVIEDYRCTHGAWAQAMAAGIHASNGINLRNIMARAVTMGDECHNRCISGTYQFMLEVISLMSKAGIEGKMLGMFAQTAIDRPTYFLSLNMAAAKNIADAGHGVAYSTVVTGLSRNGVDFGVRVSGLGDTWYTAPAPAIKGLYFSGQWSSSDACPDMGDSSITETVGLGGFIMSNAPSFIQMVGCSMVEARRFTDEMYRITLTKNPNFRIPAWDFQGSPLGIDIRKVVDLNVTPIIDTAIAARNGGFIGVGLTRAPAEAFRAAATAFDNVYIKADIP